MTSEMLILEVVVQPSSNKQTIVVSREVDKRPNSLLLSVSDSVSVRCSQLEEVHNTVPVNPGKICTATVGDLVIILEEAQYGFSASHKIL